MAMTSAFLQFRCFGPRLESLLSARGRNFSPSNLCALKSRPRISSPYEMVYFSSIMFKFCALEWALRSWQVACARKIFRAHDVLSSLALDNVNKWHNISQELVATVVHLKKYDPMTWVTSIIHMHYTRIKTYGSSSTMLRINSFLQQAMQGHYLTQYILKVRATCTLTYKAYISTLNAAWVSRCEIAL